jgi:hypothetical protein
LNDKVYLRYTRNIQSTNKPLESVAFFLLALISALSPNRAIGRIIGVSAIYITDEMIARHLSPRASLGMRSSR